jgi:drug/metabolite transporter (DMT)-like permease
MKTAVVLVAAVLANSLANICLSKGMKQYGKAPTLGLSWILATSQRVASNGWLVAGVLFLLIFFAAYLTALSWADLSFVLPSIAPAYLLTAAMSKVMLHETVSPTRWLGTVLIVTGTCFVARTYSPPSEAAAVEGRTNLEPPGSLMESPAGLEPAEPGGSTP